MHFIGWLFVLNFHWGNNYFRNKTYLFCLGDFMFHNVSAFFWFLNFMDFNFSLINSRRIVVCLSFYWISNWYFSIRFVLHELCLGSVCFLVSFYFFLLFLFFIHSQESFEEVKSSLEKLINFIYRGGFSLNMPLNQNLASLNVKLVSLNNLSDNCSHVICLRKSNQNWSQLMKFPISWIINPTGDRNSVQRLNAVTLRNIVNYNHVF